MTTKIKEKLHSLGYKLHFWYKDGKLDAICIAKWVGKDLILQKTYKEEEIAEILFKDFLQD